MWVRVECSALAFVLENDAVQQQVIPDSVCACEISIPACCLAQFYLALYVVG
jgi:hypothetical protein